MQDYITVIGGGLAGSEAVLQIAKNKIKVKLYEMKPIKFSGSHRDRAQRRGRRRRRDHRFWQRLGQL